MGSAGTHYESMWSWFRFDFSVGLLLAEQFLDPFIPYHKFICGKYSSMYICLNERSALQRKVEEIRTPW